ncbi:alpha/beta hydrolase [Patescibacteria group bacterium]|nr:alpha/beta hydrolase [Patescibacteria group bacterium]
MEPKEILIRTDGEQDALGAWLYQGAGKRLIVYLSPICLHGGWFKEALKEIAVQLEATLIAIDLPGIGQSRGGVTVGNRKGLFNKLRSCCDFELTTLCQQLQRAVYWLKQEFRPEIVYGLGSSIGGIVTSYLLAEDKGDVLDGAIFQAGFASSGAEIGQYVKPRILKIPQWRYYEELKRRFKPPIPVFVFVNWSIPSTEAVTTQFKETRKLITRFLKDPDTVISFTIESLESLINAPAIILPPNVPVLLLKSENDLIPANQQAEAFLERHPCDKTIVSLSGAPHIIFESREHTQTAIKAIQKWLEKIESQRVG